MGDLTIPDNKTCADCAYCRKCTAIFGAKPENSECDFHPVRFYPAPPTQEEES